MSTPLTMLPGPLLAGISSVVFDAGTALKGPICLQKTGFYSDFTAPHLRERVRTDSDVLP